MVTLHLTYEELEILLKSFYWDEDYRLHKLFNKLKAVWYDRKKNVSDAEYVIEPIIKGQEQ